MTKKVEVKHLTKIFGRHVGRAKEMINEGKSKDEILAKTNSVVGVHDANFDVNENEIFVIMGLSGSGKSTLIRMLNRLYEPTDGEILLDGESITKFDKKELREFRRKKMSMVFQNFALFPNRTIIENTAYGLEIQGVDKETRHQKAHECLELVGLHGYDDRYPNELSGGQQQRVGLARGLANDPEILLMDEAFSALDPLNRKEMQDELLDLQSHLKKTIIFISHDLNESLRIGDRIMIMRDGEIVQIGSPEDILQHPKNDYVEKFIEGVDRTKILTASRVMIRPDVINIEKDGPRTALRLMKDNHNSSVYVVDSEHHFKGLIDAKDVIKQIEDDKRDLESILRTDVPTTTPDTPIKSLLNDISKTSVPFAVLDDNDRLLGIIIRSSVLGAISGNEVQNNG
ncbi:Glycine betaine/carnitine transport ATP-binding protein GbuA [Apilactobacillus kunkeei]|uniref:Quaternary amine transport ATP-binding protein n=2 Tax=Apilactobacillus TaxID=2767877 RepID=A0A0C3A0B0_9LACO|nr:MULTISPECIES: glycine betaine/L-proline ABC transporter ATP-binding protein [Lactobacillaceae]MCL8494961.1 glycine betaine/L-proline ABC transporter ATP-binding protein [Apilactobacillus sp. F1]KIM18075.1 glycine/betaine ABC transporter ATP-binding protein [Apilactobacillus kunkeei]KOY73778.1 ABC superfamily ATP binding cassette transporter, ABC protein [Apilactobacillus kunkeei]KOY75771.1 ABC superfamily ATP binding cassette transporter, ABC protein [Apilactobacillus kunkeei]KPN80351.1 ABC